MILQVCKNLYVGDTEGLVFTNKKDWAIVHVSQKYHYSLFGWDHKGNKPPKNHPHYLKYKESSEMSLNLVDGGAAMYEWFGVVGFKEVLDFIDDNAKLGKKILIHCDKGESRSPSIALLYMAKRLNILNKNSYLEACSQFTKIYPKYNPLGIAEYLYINWKNIS
jgi:hypothetical protein